MHGHPIAGFVLIMVIAGLIVISNPKLHAVVFYGWGVVLILIVIGILVSDAISKFRKRKKVNKKEIG